MLVPLNTPTCSKTCTFIWPCGLFPKHWTGNTTDKGCGRNFLGPLYFLQLLNSGKTMTFYSPLTTYRDLGVEFSICVWWRGLKIVFAEQWGMVLVRQLETERAKKKKAGGGEDQNKRRRERGMIVSIWWSLCSSLPGQREGDEERGSRKRESCEASERKTTGRVAQ